uniref:Stabilization protein n=1 Tax=Geladintestivirus 2 TaxID=3233134 RepID=A0AAU8MKV7_9CAUD
MAKIVSKLNLNKTPANVEPNSLIFAKNVRLDTDGTIHRDYGILPISIKEELVNNNIVTNAIHKTNYKDIFGRIYRDCNTEDNKKLEQYKKYLHLLEKIVNGIKSANVIGKIVGVVVDSNDFYLFIQIIYQDIVTKKETQYSFISNYSEKEDIFTICNCNWIYNQGNITGNVIKNLYGDKLLTIAEYGTITPIPLKCINLTYSSVTDNETIYTQTPSIPITNLNYSGRYSATIPNGVYQFYVRYKIRDNVYTNWFPASQELYVGNTNSTNTVFGTVKYVNLHKDSDNSFILSVEHLNDNNFKLYKSFQVGFILTHEDATYARAWKHFKLTQTTIQFDYKGDDADEIEITDLTKPIYELYNVGNVTNFKNKQYISNYTETDFNEDLQNVADKINIEIKQQTSSKSYDGNGIIESIVNGSNVLSGIVLKNNSTQLKENINLIGYNGIFDKIANTGTKSLKEVIDKVVIKTGVGLDATIGNNIQLNSVYGFMIMVDSQSVNNAEDRFASQYTNIYTDTDKTEYNITCEHTISDIKVNGVSIGDANINSIYVYEQIINHEIYLNYNGIFIDNQGNIDNGVNIQIHRPAIIKVTHTKYNSDGTGDNGYVNNGGAIEDPNNPNNNSGFTGGITGDIVGSSIGNQITTGTKVTTYYINTTYVQTINLKYVGYKSKFSNTDAVDLVNSPTLIPLQKYKFYVHFIKETGETTNGYYCSNNGNGEIEIPYQPYCNTCLYPEFSNITIPNGYSACFFSLIHTKTKSYCLFNVTKYENANKLEASCLEANMGLLSVTDNIHIKQEKSETYSGHYYYSSDASTNRYFGADGIVTFDSNGEEVTDGKLAYIVSEYTLSEADDLELVKCTPFIKPNINTYKKEITGSNREPIEVDAYSDYHNMCLLGYICAVTTLDRQTSIELYTDGSGLYKKRNTDGLDISGDNKYFQLDEYSSYITTNGKPSLSMLTAIRTTPIRYIYSNYNLNYLTLSTEPAPMIKTYYTRAENITTSDNNDSCSIFLRIFQSLILSEIYNLQSMYYKYVRKTYNVYNKETNVIRYENTIRSSELVGDEERIHIFKFNPDDYYNTPSNKGIITNLIAIGNAIIVHTKDSMFKFSGNNTLQSSEGEIQTTENDVFDTGIGELFGSDFGFAGLQNKYDSIVTENGYIFFDRDSRIVYLYSGNNQLIKISDSIEKLFRHRNIQSVNFANDYYNNRFFMCITFIEEVYNGTNWINKIIPVTLSFSTLDNVKSFVSLHDFYYIRAFNTKTNCYFFTTDMTDVCRIYKWKEAFGIYTKLDLPTDIVYPTIKEDCKLRIYTPEENENGALRPNYSVKRNSSIVDVIDNSNYEIIKTLNAIHWCGGIISADYSNISNDLIKSICVAEESYTGRIPCKYLRIYTDTCISYLNDFSKVSNNENFLNDNNYKYPRYNQGRWTFNYFRNILNDNNNSHFIKETNPSHDYTPDDNSLIEGKYFVVRFIFDTDFKLETLTINYSYKQ